MSVRSNNTGQLITGYAAVYNLPSDDLGDCREIIMPGAFDNALQKRDLDCPILINHDPNLLLGRVPRTAHLTSDSYGLYFAVKLGRTTTSSNAYEEIARADMTGCSITMGGIYDQWAIEHGEWIRRIYSIENLYDVGPVTYPAYPDTTVGAFAADDLRAIQKMNESDRECLTIKTLPWRKSFQTPRVDARYRDAIDIILRVA